MPDHKLSPYRVRLRQQHKTGHKIQDPQDYWNLEDISSANGGFNHQETFLQFFERYIKSLKKDGYLNDKAERALAVIDYQCGTGSFDDDPEARTIEAELDYGRYGRPADHTDKAAFGNTTGKTLSGERKHDARSQDTVAETRLHLLFHMPVDSPHECFIILHSYGRNSTKTRVEDSLDRFIKQDYDKNKIKFGIGDEKKLDGFKLDMYPVAEPDLIEELRDSKIVGFEVRKRDTNVPKYMQEGTELSPNANGDMLVQYTSSDILSDLSLKKEELMEKINNEKYPFGELVDDDPSFINAIVERPDKSDKRINITRDEVRMEELIDTGDIGYTSDGRASLSSIGDLSREQLNEILERQDSPMVDKKSIL